MSFLGKRSSSDILSDRPLKRNKLNLSSENYENLLQHNPTLVYGTLAGYVIDNDRNLFSFGWSILGKLGHEEEDTNIVNPKEITSLSNIKMVDCGLEHTICCDFNGVVFTFGHNSYGQLGVGKDNTILSYTHIPQQLELPPIYQIASGDDFNICLTADGDMFTFGDGEDGQLGIGNNNSSTFPVLIPDFHGVLFVECGATHAICKRVDDSFYSWGSGMFGKLGHGNEEIYNFPQKCDNLSNNIVSVKCGDDHSIFLSKEGKVYSCGNNNAGQLGIDNENKLFVNIPILIEGLPNINRIECGYNHTICLDFDANIWVFGLNKNCQLGLGNNINVYKPILHRYIDNIIDISHGGDTTFLKLVDNKIYSFGKDKIETIDNDELLYPQLIKISDTHQIKPIEVFENNKTIWTQNIKIQQKSARK